MLIYRGELFFLQKAVGKRRPRFSSKIRRDVRSAQAPDGAGRADTEQILAPYPIQTIHHLAPPFGRSASRAVLRTAEARRPHISQAKIPAATAAFSDSQPPRTGMATEPSHSAASAAGMPEPSLPITTAERSSESCPTGRLPG
jgi:hypothetical protein